MEYIGTYIDDNCVNHYYKDSDDVIYQKIIFNNDDISYRKFLSLNSSTGCLDIPKHDNPSNIKTIDKISYR